MLEKTFAMLSKVKPGTYIADDVECFDRAELDELGRAIRRLIYSPSQLRSYLQQTHKVTVTRADFYSEVPTVVDLEASFKTPSLLELDAIFPDNAVMLAELEQLMQASEEFAPPQKSSRPGEFAWEGGPFGYSDAMTYYTMIRTRKPKTIVEIGSGWSTLIAKMACEKNGQGRIICIEPYPSDFLAALPGIELIQRRAQEIETVFFNEVLRDGDLLFIDSTHTVKHDSDCLHIYLRILPVIQADITVHVHDVYLPDSLTLQMLREQQIYWNEQYLLYAYLQCNPRTRVLYGSRYHWKRNRAVLERYMHGRYQGGGGSLWFHQSKPLAAPAT